MSDMRDRNVRAAEYRRLAIVADDLAQNSPLAHVREKHTRAAASWTALAMRSEQMGRDLRLSTPGSRRAPALIALPSADEDLPCIA